MRHKAVGWQSTRPSIWLRVGAPDFLGFAGEHAVKLDVVFGSHGISLVGGVLINEWIYVALGYLLTSC
jgi:hypothetical protein